MSLYVPSTNIKLCNYDKELIIFNFYINLKTDNQHKVHKC